MISELSEIAESRQQRGHKWSGQPIEFQNEKKGNRLLFDPMVFFFPLHCRASTRHGRSTTGNSNGIES